MRTTATFNRSAATPKSGFQSIHDFFKAIHLLLLADRMESAEQMQLR